MEKLIEDVISPESVKPVPGKVTTLVVFSMDFYNNHPNLPNRIMNKVGHRRQDLFYERFSMEDRLDQVTSHKHSIHIRPATDAEKAYYC